MASLKAQLVAYLADDTVLPVAGADPFAAPGTTRTTTNLAASLELYRTPHGVWLLQQRAPAAPGRQRAFAERLVAWLHASAVGKVAIVATSWGLLLLCGIPSCWLFHALIRCRWCYWARCLQHCAVMQTSLCHRPYAMPPAMTNWQHWPCSKDAQPSTCVATSQQQQ